MNPEGGGVSAWPSADRAGRPAVGGARGLPRRRRADGARQRRRAAANVANWRSGARGSATVSSPFSRARSATPRSSRARSPRRRSSSSITVPKGWVKPAAGADLAGSRRRAPTGRCATPSCSTAARCRRRRARSPARSSPRGLGCGVPPRAGARDRHRRPVDAHAAHRRCGSTDSRRAVQDRARRRRSERQRACQRRATRASTRSAVSVSFGDGQRGAAASASATATPTPGIYTIVVARARQARQRGRRTASW